MANERPGKRNKVLTSRNYIHISCGKVTELDGAEFRTISNPLAEIVQTHCSHCEIDDSMREFRWEDTDETLSDYIDRHRENIPDDVLDLTAHDQVVKFATRGAIVGGVVAVVLGIGIGMATSATIGIVSGIVLAIIGVPLGAVLRFMSFEKKVVQPNLEKYLGVKDVGELR